MTQITSDTNGSISQDAIEQTLRELWDEMAKQGGEMSHTRTLNLLVYVPTELTSELRSRITGVAVQQPGRTITLQPSDEPAKAEVSIACRAGANMQACGEQILLQGGGGGQALVSLAAALLQPGLPVAAWWHGAPTFDQQPFPAIVEVADHVLVDSRTWESPVRYLREFAALRQQYDTAKRFSDLQWVALTPWRQLVAQTFDTPAAVGMLPEIATVMIGYAGGENIVGALLLAAWLMTRLGWVLSEEAVTHDVTGMIVPLRSGEHHITLALRTQDGHHGINSVSLATDGQPAATVRCEEQQDAMTVETMITIPPAPPVQRVTLRQHLSSTVLIGAELAQTHGDPVYTAALEQALLLSEKLGNLI